MISRRQFLKLGAIAGAGLVLGANRLLDAPPAFASYQTLPLRKFAQPLRGVGPGGIPVATPDAFRAPVTGALHYTIGVRQYTDQLHPDLDPTTLRGFHPLLPLGGGAQPQKHLGGIIVAQKGQPVQITFRNKLPTLYPLPIDKTIMGANNGNDRVCVHLHGGFVPWVSDGGPFAWFSAGGKHGRTFVNNQVLNPNAAFNEAEYYYPNAQSARLMWYHDHTYGITRLNAYAGIATAYIIRDAFESNLRNYGLPDFVENGGREIPLVIQDKFFVGPTIDTDDPTWPGPKGVGSLWYPHKYDADTDPPGTVVDTDPSCVPEMFGDTMLANGTVYPEATVEARVYRLRLLNACNARFLNLQLYVEDQNGDSITLVQQPDGSYIPNNAPGPNWLVLGTEGGFLPNAVEIPSNLTFDAETYGGSLVTAPAERWDVLVDFSGFEGKNLILYNDAPAPFPMGDPGNDYFPTSQSQFGSGPNTRQIMRFKVIPATGKDVPLQITPKMDLRQGNAPLLVPAIPRTALPIPPGVKVRQLTLNETFDDKHRLIQKLGTHVAVGQDSHGVSLYGRAYNSPSTENPRAGATEIWQIANLTGDTHPIHFHLVNVHLLSRQEFNVDLYNGTPILTGAPRGPEPTELGWKETLKMHPGDVTTVMIKFDLPKVPFTVPSSPRTGGNEYVWHCHILEHEEHDMMRPLVVT